MSYKTDLQSNNTRLDALKTEINNLPTYVDTTDANATESDILSGKSGYVNGVKVNGNMTNLGQLDITPTTSAQTIPAGYTSGGTVNAVPDETSVLNAQDTLLATQDIKISDLATALDNKIALDLTNATADANATASDIKQGKSAYVNGQKINGTIPQFTNDITSLNSMIEYEIRSFNNYLETHFEQDAPYLNEPITIYAPDENMKYFVISKLQITNQYRILWSKFKFAGLKHSSNTQDDINLIKELAYGDTPTQIIIDEFTFNSPIYASGWNTHLANKTDTYKSNGYSTLEDLISAISNPNSSITYSHPTNSSSYGSNPNIELITNMYVWDNNISSSSTALKEWVTTQKLSNNITILPLNS